MTISSASLNVIN